MSDKDDKRKEVEVGSGEAKGKKTVRFSQADDEVIAPPPTGGSKVSGSDDGEAETAYGFLAAEEEKLKSDQRFVKISEQQALHLSDIRNLIKSVTVTNAADIVSAFMNAAKNIEANKDSYPEWAEQQQQSLQTEQARLQRQLGRADGINAEFSQLSPSLMAAKELSPAQQKMVRAWVMKAFMLEWMLRTTQEFLNALDHLPQERRKPGDDAFAKQQKDLFNSMLNGEQRNKLGLNVLLKQLVDQSGPTSAVAKFIVQVQAEAVALKQGGPDVLPASRSSSTSAPPAKPKSVFGFLRRLKRERKGESDAHLDQYLAQSIQEIEKQLGLANIALMGALRSSSIAGVLLSYRKLAMWINKTKISNLAWALKAEPQLIALQKKIAALVGKQWQFPKEARWTVQEIEPAVNHFDPGALKAALAQEAGRPTHQPMGVASGSGVGGGKSKKNAVSKFFDDSETESDEEEEEVADTKKGQPPGFFSKPEAKLGDLIGGLQGSAKIMLALKEIALLHPQLSQAFTNPHVGDRSRLTIHYVGQMMAQLKAAYAALQQENPSTPGFEAAKSRIDAEAQGIATVLNTIKDIARIQFAEITATSFKGLTQAQKENLYEWSELQVALETTLSGQFKPSPRGRGDAETPWNGVCGSMNTLKADLLDQVEQVWAKTQITQAEYAVVKAQCQQKKEGKAAAPPSVPGPK